jgi:hypothetical protein
MGLVVNDYTKTVSGSKYKSSDVDINLPTHDTDVTLFLPNGTPIVIQWRVEGPSIDICLDTERPVNNWEGDDMKPAPRDPHEGDYDHIRMAKQLCIPLPNAVLEPTDHK